MDRKNQGWVLELQSWALFNSIKFWEEWLYTKKTQTNTLFQVSDIQETFFFFFNLKNTCLVYKNTELNFLKMSRHTKCNIDVDECIHCFSKKGQDDVFRVAFNIHQRSQAFVWVVVLSFVIRFWLGDGIRIVDEIRIWANNLLK